MLVQDTAWDGYEQVPAWIVEGYDTMLEEVDEQLAAAPDLVAVPVGVGSLAQAVVAHYRRPGLPHPALLSVEPDAASCALASLTAGVPVTVNTSKTVMAGLNCGTVSTSAWPVLLAGCDAAVSVTDADALRAVDDPGRLGVSSGPSGAATLAGVRGTLAVPERRAALGIDPPRPSSCSALKEQPMTPRIRLSARPPATSADVVNLLEALVRIDSANPALSDAAPGEVEVAAYVADWAQAAGLRVELVERTPGRPSVLVRGGRAAGGRRLMLCGHLDTVGLAGMDHPRHRVSRVTASTPAAPTT